MSNLLTKPFVEISIVSLNDDGLKKSDILDLLHIRLSKLQDCDLKYLKFEDETILRIEFRSFTVFYEIYRREFELYEYIIQLYNYNKIEFEKQFPVVHNPPNPEDPDFYLILKYTTNDKDPLRKNYQFTLWFADKFDELWMYEETENGFLHFYRRKEDFLNSNLNKCDSKELQQYLKNKKLKLSPEVMNHILACMKR